MILLGLIEQALKTGDSPEVLPIPLVQRCFEHWRSKNMELIMSAELIRDEDYRKFCVALNSYLNFLGAIDNLVLVVKEALGKPHVVSRNLLDSEESRDRWYRMFVWLYKPPLVTLAQF